MLVRFTDKLEELVKCLTDKLAEDIELFDVSEIVGYTDYFLLATARNEPHIKTLRETVISKAEEIGLKLLYGGVEGTTVSGWILLDFGDLIVHLFSREKRDYYSLDKLFMDAPRRSRVPSV